MIRLAWLLALTVLLAGCGGAGAVAASAGRHRATSSPAASPTPRDLPVATPIMRTADDPTGPPGPTTANVEAGPQPVRVRIPTIGIDSTLAQLGLNGDGTIQVPPDFNQAGWYTRGPAPGDPGPAIILGHVDSYTGPAIFARLSTMRPGDKVSVDRADGSVAGFTVQRVETVPVDPFPTQEVYGATPEPSLRLITCGGSYSLVQRRYLSNVVVFATLSGVRSRPG